MPSVNVISVGDSLGIIIPDHLVIRLQLVEGTALELRETGYGFELKSNDLFAQHMKIAEAIMAKEHEVLRRLAE